MRDKSFAISLLKFTTLAAVRAKMHALCLVDNDDGTQSLRSETTRLDHEKCHSATFSNSENRRRSERDTNLKSGFDDFIYSRPIDSHL